jgi:hypothetical protein
VTEVQAQEAPTRPVRRVFTACVGWALVAGLLLLLVAAAVAGERETTYDTLRTAASHGDVDLVTVEGSSAPFRGREQVEVHWRTGPFGVFGHVAPVVEQHPFRGLGAIDPPAVVPDVAADLAQRNADVVVVRRPWSSAGHAELLGWRMPMWTGFLGLVLWFFVLGGIVTGTQPWRATRWAWFWLLVIVPPVALLGFPLLGGPTGLWPPRRPLARLTGGGAFLLAVVTSAAASAVAASGL